ncbi:hypothetical protein MSP8887_00584 [Marinomonas spartinae]|uniref:hypothetical protein n=1 Tax=Marinomonas spartinae TaxID=1792290 RepID=UPI000808D90F|nr:hypothetical protein [Marinomonas spartinae]SBS27241.1 hypothetical protein MSP8887_00584 [Marinomonas spartinae]
MLVKNNFFDHWKLILNSGLKVPGRAFSNPKFVFSFLVIMVISSAGVWAPWAFDINLSSVCYVEKKDLENNDLIQDGKILNTKPYKLNAKDNELHEIESYKEPLPSKLEVLKDACAYVSEIPIILFQGFAIFMFNLGLLGGIAFEFFINQGLQRYQELKFDDEKINKLRLNEFAGFFVWVVAFVFSFYGLKEPTTTSYLSILGSFLALSLWICCNFNKAVFEHSKPNPENIEAGGVFGEDTESELEGDGLK